MMFRILWLVLVSGLAMDSVAAAPDAMLLQQACGRAAGDIGPSESRMIRVSCTPHTTLAGLPALFVVDCQRVSSRWQCARPDLVMRMAVGAGSVLLSPQGVGFATTREVAAVLADHPWHFNGRDLAGMLQGLCRIADTGGGAFAGARDYRVRCGDRGVIVTKACVDARCRLFPARWDDT